MPSEKAGPKPLINKSFAPQHMVESSRIVSEALADAVITIDSESKILYANKAVVKIFGYSMEELIGSDLTMLMPEYLRHLHHAALKNYLTTGIKHLKWDSIELPGRHKSGQELALELSFGEFEKDGERFFTGIARDVSQRRQAEQRLFALQKITDSALSHLRLDDLLSESLERIREVLHVDTVAILLLRSEGDELVAWAARGLEEEVELGVRIPVGVGFAGRIVARVQPIIIEDIDKFDVYNPLLREKGIKSLLGVPLVATGRPIGVLHVGKFHSYKFGEEEAQLLRLAADRLAMAIENSRLYEVEKTARAAAEEANRAKDDFLTVLSHELRTPLTPIIGWIQMIENDILPESEYRRAITVVNKNAYGLKRLINDLLDMSAILSGKMRVEQDYIVLQDVIAESLDTMRSQAEESGVTLRFERAPGRAPITVKGDRSRLNQSFSNILHNAIKFSQPGTEVSVRCKVAKSQAVITFTDEGEGIPEKFLPHVFERFRQADGSRTRSHGGLGLGLALVQSFIHAHGGTIAVESEGKGKGAKFTIKLPVAIRPEAASLTETRATSADTASARRLLLVEDQPDTLFMLAEHFRMYGYQTFACSGAVEALEVAKRQGFDLLISDIAMPGMDGFELIRKLREQTAFREVPAIALTGYASQKDAGSALAAGFNLHLSKPIDPAELAAAAEALIEQHKESRS